MSDGDGTFQSISPSSPMIRRRQVEYVGIYPGSNMVIRRQSSKSEYELQCRSNSINPYLTSKNKRECIAAGMDYTDSRSMAELRKRSNWKPKNDKVYESREERSQRKLESYKFNTRLIAKEVEYEVGIAM